MSNATAKKYKNGVDMMNNPDLEEGYNTRFINFTLAITPTEPLDYTDVAEMDRRFNRYLQLCSEWDMKITNQGAYLAIGIDKSLAWDWSNRHTQNKERCDFIKKVQKICGYYREGMMANGKINPVVGIFWQKNYDGFKDQQEVVLTPNNPLGDGSDAEQLKEKYLADTYGADTKVIEQKDDLPQDAQKRTNKALEYLDGEILD